MDNVAMVSKVGKNKWSYCLQNKSKSTKRIIIAIHNGSIFDVQSVIANNCINVLLYIRYSASDDKFKQSLEVFTQTSLRCARACGVYVIRVLILHATHFKTFVYNCLITFRFSVNRIILYNYPNTNCAVVAIRTQSDGKMLLLYEERDFCVVLFWGVLYLVNAQVFVFVVYLLRKDVCCLTTGTIS